MSPVQWMATGGALLLLAAVIELVRRRKLTEEYSLLWIACALLVLGLSMRREWLDAVALRLGIFYPPSLLLLGLGAFVLLATLAFSVALSRQRRQIDRLVEEVAILEARQRRMERDARSGAAVTPNEVIPRAAHEGGQSPEQRHVPRAHDVGTGEQQH